MSASLVFPGSSGNTCQCLLKTEAVVTGDSGRELTVQVTGKVDSHIEMLLFSSALVCVSVSVDIIHGFAVNSEWKKRIKSQT